MPAPAAASKAAQEALLRRSTELQAEITRASIERALRGEPNALTLLDIIQRVYGRQDAMTKAMEQAMRAGFAEGHRSLRFPAETQLTKDTSAAQTQVARLFFARAQEQYRLITSLIGQGVPTGYTVREVASLIHDVIGLSPRYANAVIRYRDSLVGELQGWEASAAARRYAMRLQRARARMTGVTETNIARNVGVEQTWRVSVRLGLLTGTARRIWVVTEDERLCPRCRVLDGMATGLDEPWMTPEGVPIMTPGLLHPHCRCEERLEIV